MWKPVAGFETTHEVSSCGKVRSLDKLVVDSLGRKRPVTGRMLKPTRKSNGYLHLTLCGEQGQKTLHLHRIVLESFVGPCPVGMEALHHDGNRENNQVANLRWGTHLENCADRSRHGSSGHVLSFEKAEQIRAMKDTHTRKALASMFGVSVFSTMNVIKNRVWNVPQECSR